MNFSFFTKIFLIVIIYIFTRSILASGEFDLTGFKNDILSAPTLAHAVIMLDKLAGIDSSIAEKRLEKLLSGFSSNHRNSELKLVQDIVFYLENKWDLKRGKNIIADFPYSEFLAKGSWSCIVSAIDFQSLASINNISTNVMRFEDHVVNLTILDRKEWVVDLLIGKDGYIYASNYVKNHSGLIRKNHNYMDREIYSLYVNDYKESNKKYNAFAVPLSRSQFLANYLLHLGLYFNNRRNFDKAKAIFQSAELFFPDYDPMYFDLILVSINKRNFEDAEYYLSKMSSNYYYNLGRAKIEDFR